MKDETTAGGFKKVSRPELIDLLNQDLSREYQAIIGYVVYSQVLKGAEFMNIAGELEKHDAQELSHALIIAKQIDYLGVCRRLKPRPSEHQKKPPRCCSLISTTKRKRFEIIASESANARSWLSMPWANRFARS